MDSVIPPGVWVDDSEDDDPLLRRADGSIVDTWREDFPYAERLDRDSYEHAKRLLQAAFAALGGTSPIPASSGKTVRHRLNHGGDRALNRAIHAIALTRIRSCPRTRAYVARRTAEGKAPREIRRCLKRYIARELYRQLTGR
jgi:hypothetical protein